MGTGTFIYRDGVEGGVDLSTHTHTHRDTSSKWQRNPPTTYGVPSEKLKLDMETTCLRIHVTAGSMSPSQPKPITERLLFQLPWKLITSVLY